MFLSLQTFDLQQKPTDAVKGLMKFPKSRFFIKAIFETHVEYVKHLLNAKVTDAIFSTILRRLTKGYYPNIFMGGLTPLNTTVYLYLKTHDWFL